MALSTVTYALDHKYTDDSIKGIDGVLAGKNATIEEIEEFDAYSIVHFKWTADDGTVKRRQITVQNGVSVADMKIIDEHLIIFLTDGTEIDAGELISGIKTGIWIGSTTPPSEDYVLWIDPKAPEQGIPTASAADIDSLWD